MERLIHTVVLDKQESSSYRERNEANELALNTAFQTFGLGAGWGECRASSFIPTLLGNVGLPGALLFGLFCFKVLRPGLRITKTRLSIHGAVLLALSALLLALAVAGPEIVDPIIWLLFSVAAKLAVRSTARPSRSRPSHFLAESIAPA